MNCIDSDTDIGMNRNSSDWLGMNFIPLLSPGQNIGRDLKRFTDFLGMILNGL